jgi:signal-transduction protein with cAMP-binding, CBS, and nucleotidyltransferase domain
MRLADVLNSCTVRTVTVNPEVSLAEAAQAMHKAGASVLLVVEDQQPRSLLTRSDILHSLTIAASPVLAWEGPLATTLTEAPRALTSEETVGRALVGMMEAKIDYLPVITVRGIVVVSFSNLLLAENAQLHGEVQHLQTYIDALHDAPND